MSVEQRSGRCRGENTVHVRVRECASPYLDLAFPPSNYPSSAHLLMLKKFKKRNRRSDHEAQPQDEGVHDNFPLIHRDSPFRW